MALLTLPDAIIVPDNLVACVHIWSTCHISELCA